ncbi:hypothetical protein C0966_17050 (plasmid) [Bacillus methanolicus]|uniref:hypothetical protein n=1 Tax=Bacillus methanolicus TaxID=1471 RepID=UPI0023801062|nr:hypothetical protein [Bacillus methanolicus]MDE3840975.1 hypothetical protein [Bacillus methanolicus]
MAICKAFLLENNTSAEFLVNLSNLPAFLYLHKDVYEIVIVGHLDNHFVLKKRYGKILFCNQPSVKRWIEQELKSFRENEEPELHLFQAFVHIPIVEKVNIFSNTQGQAYKDFEEWSQVRPLTLIKIA